MKTLNALSLLLLLAFCFLLSSSSSCSKSKTPINLCTDEFDVDTQNWISNKINQLGVDYVFQANHNGNTFFMIYETMAPYQLFDCEGTLLYSSDNFEQKQILDDLEKEYHFFEIYPNDTYYDGMY